MRLLGIPIGALSTCLILVSGVADAHDELDRRALAAAPNGYTPAQVQCPSKRPTIRAPLQLSSEESQWLAKRRPVAADALKELLSRINIPHFDSSGYIDNNKNDVRNLPNIAIAASGGGYRALMNGAGALQAFDSRTPGSTRPGHLGGLLQSSTYVSGLSGGGWLVGSIFTNNFTSVQSILDASAAGTGNLWAFDRNIIEGPKTRSLSVASTAGYFKTLYNQVQGKREAGFDASVTDYWGRGLAYQLVNTSNGGLAYTWSSITDQPGFGDGKIPMPILVADGRAPGETVVSPNATIFEINPWEMGSYDPQLFGMVPLKYMGSNFDTGKLPKSEPCISGFDNVGFVMGTSSSLWNAVVLRVLTLKSEGLFGSLISGLKDAARKFGDNQDDIADWSPNPFYGWNRGANPSAVSRNLTLVDGGEDGQNVPLYPHLQPQRAVDVIFAIDSSADTGDSKGWPNGTSLIATYERSKAAIQNGTAFPAIPDVNTFINLGLNSRPTFFGCDSKNQTGPSPIIIYIANHPYSYFSNITTFTTTVNNTERNAIIQNGYNAATMGNGTIEEEWPVCAGCAILSRSFERTNTPVPPACQDCFQRHCWNGTRDSRPVTFDPPLGGSASKSPKTSSKAKKNGAGSMTVGMSGLSLFAFGLAAWVAV